MNEKLKTIKKVADWLFKDIGVYDAVNPFLIFVFLFAVKFILIGFQTESFTTYFEAIAIFLLVFIMLLLIPIKHEGYVGVINILMGIGGIVLVAFDNPILITGSMKIYIYFVSFHIMYAILNFCFNYLVKHYPRKRKIITRKMRKK